MSGGNSERAMLADAIDEIDAEIKVLNKGKSEALKAHREKLVARGMDARRATAELHAIKAAVARRRKLLADPTAVREKDDLTDEILNEIMGPSRAREAVGGITTQNPSNSGLLSSESGRKVTTGFTTHSAEPEPPMVETDATGDASDSLLPVATQSTAARKDVQRSVKERADRKPLEEGGSSSVTETSGPAGNADQGKVAGTSAEAARDPQTQSISPAGTQAPPVDTIPDTRTQIQKTMDRVQEEAAAKQPVNPRRPYCQRPHACGSSNPRAHCTPCQQLHAEAEGFSA